MDNRKKSILKAIVDDYIECAEPVGSKALAERHGMELSAATLRNEMAYLERLGFLEQPHTSAGRVPTPMGYRLYVDDLMNRHKMAVSEMEAINNALRERVSEYGKMLEEAGRLIASLTRYASVAASTKPERHVLKRLELFLAEPQDLVAVAVMEAGLLKNKLIKLAFPASASHIRMAADALNACFAGASSIEDELVARCVIMAGDGAAFVSPVIDFLREALEAPSGHEVVLSGEARLLDHPEFRDVLKVRSMLEYLTEQRQSLVSSMPLGSPDDVRITIGPENAASELQDASVIMASFSMRDGQRGLIGLVGPTRMDYSRLASRLTYFARRLSILIQQEEDSP